MDITSRLARRMWDANNDLKLRQCQGTADLIGAQCVGLISIAEVAPTAPDRTIVLCMRFTGISS